MSSAGARLAGVTGSNPLRVAMLREEDRCRGSACLDEGMRATRLRHGRANGVGKKM